MGQQRLRAGSAQKNLGGKKKAVVQQIFPQIEEPTGQIISSVSLTCAATLPTSRNIERRMVLVMVGVVVLRTTVSLRLNVVWLILSEEVRCGSSGTRSKALFYRMRRHPRLTMGRSSMLFISQ
jgi:hypothetical protein